MKFGPGYDCQVQQDMTDKSVSKQPNKRCIEVGFGEKLFLTYAHVRTNATSAIISRAVKMPRYLPLYLLGSASFAAPHQDRMISVRYGS